MSTLEHKRCLKCGYILDGLPENRCPECGREFDPTDPQTYLSRITSGLTYLVGAIIGIVMLGLYFALILLYEHGMPYIQSILGILAPILSVGGSCVEFYVLITSFTTLRRPVGAIKHRIACRIAFFVSALVVIAVVALFFLPSIY